MIERPPHHLLLTGGARSGKSALAEQVARSWARPVTYLATATAGDDDMAARIAAHRRDRPADWRTVEEPTALHDAVDAIDDGDGLVIDCLTLWVTNLHLADTPDVEIDSRAARVAGLVTGRAGPVVVVTNEVGAGIVPPTESGRRFRDLLGRVNRTFAEHLEKTVLVVAGHIVPLSPPAALFPPRSGS